MAQCVSLHIKKIWRYGFWLAAIKLKQTITAMFLYYIVYTCTMSHLGGQKDNSNGFTGLFYTD